MTAAERLVERLQRQLAKAKLALAQTRREHYATRKGFLVAYSRRANKVLRLTRWLIEAVERAKRPQGR